MTQACNCAVKRSPEIFPRQEDFEFTIGWCSPIDDRQSNVASRSVWVAVIARAVAILLASGVGTGANRSEAAQPEHAPLEQIIVVFKTHFDIGYTDMAVNIVRKYRTTMIDQALDVVDRNRDLPPDQQFAWTIPGWPMHKILEDWDGQTPQRRLRILSAFKTGRFVVHALPFSTHTETLELEDLVRGMGFASQICRSTGLELPRDAKMTDVPEHTWVLPTLLKAAGVEFLHIGCNGGSAPMQVPPLFWWEGPDGSRLLTMYATQYGTQLAPPADWKHRTWLALMHTGDNHGPPRPEEVKKLLDEAVKKMPGVKVKIGRLSDFADAILAEKSDIPVVRGDMPDTWIHGPMSDPQGMALARHTRPKIATAECLNALMRLWGAPVRPLAPTIASAYEQSLLYGEHTWGASIGWIGNKIPFGDDFTTAGRDGKLARSEASWEEHTDYIRTASILVGAALDANLKMLAQGVQTDGPRLVVYNPLPWRRDGIVSVTGHLRGFAGVCVAGGGDVLPVQWSEAGGRFVARDMPPMGYRTYIPVRGEADVLSSRTNPADGRLENADWRLKIDLQRGAIASLLHKPSGRELVEQGGDAALGQHVYERFDQKAVQDFIKAYCRGGAAGWVQGDFGKVGMPVGSTYERKSPAFSTGAEVKDGPVATEMSLKGRLQIAAGKGCDVSFGATLYRGLPYVDIDLTVKDKPLEPWPEAMWMSLPLNIPSPRFLLGRVGSVIDPAKDVLPGANRHMFTLNTGMLAMAADSSWGVGICPLDSPMVSLDQPGCWKYSPDFVPRKPHVFVNLCNNQWSTNFRLWNGGQWTSRVRLWVAGRNDIESALIVPSMEARYELQSAMVDGPAGTLPSEQSGIEVSRKGVMVTAFGANSDGPGTLLRLWELSGKSGLCVVILPEGLTHATWREVDLRGRPISGPVALDKLGIHLTQPASDRPCSRSAASGRGILDRARFYRDLRQTSVRGPAGPILGHVVQGRTWLSDVDTQLGQWAAETPAQVVQRSQLRGGRLTVRPASARDAPIANCRSIPYTRAPDPKESAMNPAIPTEQSLAWPVSNSYHQASNLAPQQIKAFGETIAEFGRNAAGGAVVKSEKAYPGRPHIPLPPGAQSRGLTLMESLKLRRTRRRFSGRAASLPMIAALLRNSAGINGEATGAVPAGASPQLRAWPSAGGLYPIELYLLPLKCMDLSASVYHHSPQKDALVDVAPMPPRPELEKIIFAEGLWSNASLLIVFTAIFARSQAKYGERGYRFVHQEAGHLMQNLLLVAEDLRLNAVALGGFFEDSLAAILNVNPAEESPIYAVLVGTAE